MRIDFQRSLPLSGALASTPSPTRSVPPSLAFSAPRTGLSAASPPGPHHLTGRPAPLGSHRGSEQKGPGGFWNLRGLVSPPRVYPATPFALAGP